MIIIPGFLSLFTFVNVHVTKRFISRFYLNSNVLCSNPDRSLDTFFFLYCPADLTKAFPLLAMFHKPTLMLIFSGSRNVLTTRIKKKFRFGHLHSGKSQHRLREENHFSFKKSPLTNFQLGKKLFLQFFANGRAKWIDRERTRERERDFEKVKSQ